MAVTELIESGDSDVSEMGLPFSLVSSGSISSFHVVATGFMLEGVTFDQKTFPALAYTLGFQNCHIQCHP